MNSWVSKPTIIIKKVSSGKYRWFLFLSNNRKKPTCISPSEYQDAFKCRHRAKEFAAKFKGPLLIKDIESKSSELIDNSVLVIDETKMPSSEALDESVLDGVEFRGMLN